MKDYKKKTLQNMTKQKVTSTSIDLFDLKAQTNQMFGPFYFLFFIPFQKKKKKRQFTKRSDDHTTTDWHFCCQFGQRTNITNYNPWDKPIATRFSK